MDRRQIEFVKSGKLVPVNFSSRHWDFKRSKWMFGKAMDDEIATLIHRKVYWQAKLVGGDVWLGDETEAQYVKALPIIWQRLPQAWPVRACSRWNADMRRLRQH